MLRGGGGGTYFSEVAHTRSSVPHPTHEELALYLVLKPFLINIALATANNPSDQAYHNLFFLEFQLGCKSSGRFLGWEAPSARKYPLSVARVCHAVKSVSVRTAAVSVLARDADVDSRRVRVWGETSLAANRRNHRVLCFWRRRSLIFRRPWLCDRWDDKSFLEGNS